MKTMRHGCDYRSSTSVKDSTAAVPAVTAPSLSRHRPIVWSVRGMYLVAWGLVGILVWVPRLLGGVLLFLTSRAHCTLTGRCASSAERPLRSAAELYRSFVTAVDAVQAPDEGSPLQETEHQTPIGLRSLVPQIAWAAFVWYLVLWPAGVIEATPVDFASSFATAPWSEMWAGTLRSLASIPGLFS
jgi:hypothetical protein